MSTVAPAPDTSATSATSAGTVKLTVALPVDAINIVEDIAKAESKTKTQVLREAIALKGLITSELSREGTRFLIERPGEPLREIVFT